MLAFVPALVSKIHPTDVSFPSVPAEVGNVLYFSATDGTRSFQLWKSDGTSCGTVLVKDTRPGTIGVGLDQMTTVNGALLFVADKGVNRTELWWSD